MYSYFFQFDSLRSGASIQFGTNYVKTYICIHMFAQYDNSEAIIGDLRVQTLTPTLIRVEPKGSMGFEDRSTFMVVDRSFMGVPILKVQSNEANGTTITTEHYTVVVKNVSSSQ